MDNDKKAIQENAESSSEDVTPSPITPERKNFGILKPLTAVQIVSIFLNPKPTMAACIY